ncbi:hypothetical protein D3C72_860330 [compost metagenome]
MRQERDQRRHHHRQRLGIQHLLGLVAIGQHRHGGRTIRGDHRGERIQPVAFFHHKGLRGGHQFLQVLDAVLAFLLAQVVGDQAAGVDHVLDGLGQRHAAGVVAHLVDQAREGGELAAGRAGHVGHRLGQRAVVLARHVLQHFQRARADAARREIDHAAEGGVVARVLQQLHVSQRVLDFGALEEAQAAVHAVRDAGGEQRMLDHARLRVAAVQDRDLGAAGALRDLVADFLDDPARFLAVGAGLVHAHRLAVAGVGAQVLAEAARVVRDQVVGRIQDMPVRAVVLLQLDQPAHAELVLEVAHIADVGAAEGVDALVVVAHGKHRGRVLRAVAGQQLEPLVLQHVGVLELVHQHVAEAVLVVLADGVVVAQQFVAAQ